SRPHHRSCHRKPSLWYVISLPQLAGRGQPSPRTPRRSPPSAQPQTSPAAPTPECLPGAQPPPPSTRSRGRSATAVDNLETPTAPSIRPVFAPAASPIGGAVPPPARLLAGIVDRPGSALGGGLLTLGAGPS